MSMTSTLSTRLIPATVLSRILLLTAALCVALGPQLAHAAKDHCRTITFTGVAGEGSQDTITIDVVEPDAAVIDTACPMQVTGGETNIEFLSRMSARWGDNDGVDCPVSIPADEELPIKKICTNATAFGPSCRLKTKVKADKKNPGEYKKKQVEICCYEEADCKVKLGKNDASRVPVSVRAQRNDGTPCPLDEELPSEPGTFCVVNLDPIGMTGLPSAQATACRANIGKNIAKLMNGTSATLGDCHKKRMAGDIPIDTNCNEFDDAITQVNDFRRSRTALGCNQVRTECVPLSVGIRRVPGSLRPCRYRTLLGRSDRQPMQVRSPLRHRSRRPRRQMR
jgi:hypothetical protein